MSIHFPHRVTIQTETRTSFGGGAYTTTWTTETTVWANCQSVFVKTDETYDKKQQFTNWKVRFSYFPSLTSKKRLIFESKVLRINGVTHLTNRGRSTEAICVEEEV